MDTSYNGTSWSSSCARSLSFKYSAGEMRILYHGSGSTARSNQLDPCVVAYRARQTSVSRHERCVERLGERDIDGVIRRQVVPEFPDARQQKAVRVSVQRKIREIVERCPAPRPIDLTGRCIATNDLRRLDVEQVRRV